MVDAEVRSPRREAASALGTLPCARWRLNSTSRLLLSDANDKDLPDANDYDRMPMRRIFALRGLRSSTSVGLMASVAVCVGCGKEASRTGSRAGDFRPATKTCPEYALPDSLESPTGNLVARVTVADRGLRDMQIVDRGRRVTVFRKNRDLVNMLWTPDSSGLLYAVSPIYDAPGIYLFNARTGKTGRVVNPTNTKDRAYSEGADWFVLCSVESAGHRGVVVRYLHFRDVDSVDFRNFPYDAPQMADTVRLAQ
jgi:hypothetical protein